jgi:hypothetical protein
MPVILMRNRMRLEDEEFKIKSPDNVLESGVGTLDRVW